MPVVTLRVTNLRRAACSRPDAERPERHADAERRTVVETLREQVRSHGLRPESKADLCITMSALCGSESPERAQRL
ncbi:hypothetical protein CXB36_23570 [Pseudomonas syringae pv. syringae]|nr:hypothetical protein BKC06_002620 [Pseudomonas syringae pv. syringae]POP62163.1 hypothetical protein CXB36_23570 [Pseudomonas syringae pv. syringae]